MDKLVATLAPLLAFLAWLLWRSLTDRPPTRLTVNAVTSLLLLAYLLATAGLGLFWVSRQELPVFDWHYLVGYSMLGLLAVHVSLNLHVVVAWLGLRSTKGDPLVSPTSRSGRLAFVTLLVLYGGASYLLGLRHGAREIHLSWDPPRPAAARSFVQTAPAAMTPALTIHPGSPAVRVSPAASPSQLPNARSHTPPSTQAAGLPLTGGSRALQDKGRASPAPVGPGVGPLSVVQTYHLQSSHSRHRELGEAPSVSWAIPKPYRSRRGSHPVRLPRPGRPGHLTASEALRLEGLPERPSLAPLSKEELGELLHHTGGITGHRGGHAFRAAASAGALYPVELYVLASRVDGLAPGLYHYGPKDHSLVRLSGPEVRSILESAVEVPSAIGAAPVTLVLTLLFARTGQKYGDRAYRYATLDLGHVVANLVAVATELGRPVQLLGRFDDRRVVDALGVAGTQEGALLIVPLAAAEPARDQKPVPWAFCPPPERFPKSVGVTALVHRATSLAAGERRLEMEGAIPPDPGPLSQILPKRPRELVPGSWKELPKPIAGSGKLLEVIRKRRSRRRFTDDGFSLAEASSLLYHALSTSHGQTHAVTASRLDLSPGHRVFLVVNRVGGLGSGLHEYDRFRHRVRLLRAGDWSNEASTATVNQLAIREAPLVIVFAADLVEALARDGVRCYRYLLADAGRMAGNVYLDGIGRGLGACSIGAFYDDDALELVEADPLRELVLHFVAVGRSR